MTPKNKETICATSILIGIWFIGWMLTWTALLADLQGKSPSQTRFRHDLGYTMFISAFPPVWLLAPFMTGFWEYGFQIFPNK